VPDIEEIQMTRPTVVSPAEWETAHQELLAKEKAATKASDALAAERRRQPMVAFRNDYVLEGPDGRATLLDLFDGRRQLIVYHFMMEPGADPCVGCSFFADQIPELAHIHARDTSLVLVSRAPLAELEAHRERMGWTVPWLSSFGSDFNADCGIGTLFGLSVFLRDGDEVFRTYFTSDRGSEPLGSAWSFLDLTPLGRQETWEDSPEGYPQTPPFQWWRLHDEY
jgi:predicted dithiol-disulfide oxidoreductase (DUF899 family)